MNKSQKTNNDNMNGDNQGSTAVPPSGAANNFPEVVTSTDSNHEKQQLTGFTNSGEVKQATTLQPRWFKRLYKKANDGFERDIKMFLGTPVAFESGNFAITDTVSSFAPHAMPREPIANIPMWTQKLKGFLGIRCDIVLKLQVNAMPFQQGRYMLCWVPLGGVIDQTTRVNKWYFSHTATRTQRTQLPHVEIDVNTDTEVTLRIPYNSVMNFMDVDNMINGSTATPTLGTYQIFPYSALVSPAGSTTASYTVWVSLENVDLIGAVVPQMGTETEQKSKGMGPVEQVSGIIRQSANSAVSVPLISQFASPIAWAAGLVEGVASVFGWSKPANLDRHYYIQRQGLHQFGNMDSADSSQVVAYSVKNQVDVAAGSSGTDVDEMDFAAIATIPAFIMQFPWSTSDITGSRLVAMFTTPNTYTVSTNGSGSNPVYNYPPCAFISQFFAYWRGSLIYKFKFVKTNFHSGRVAVSYWPSASTGAVNISNYSFANTNYLHREIIDVREGAEFVFRVPYISATPYKRSDPLAYNNLVPGDIGNATSGMIAMHVVDTLKAASTVSSTVTILVEISAGDDIEYAQPRNADNVQPLNSVVPQMNTEENDNTLYAGDLGSMKQTNDAVSSAVVCIGEKIRNFRAMLRVPIPISLTTAANFNSSKYLTILPFSLNNYTVGAVNDAYPAVNSDFYGILGNIFLYSRGGIRLKTVNTNVAGTLMANATLVPNRQINSMTNMVQTGSTPLGVTDTWGARTFSPQQYSQVETNKSTEFTIPMYNMVHSRINIEYTMDGTTPFNTSITSSTSNQNVVNMMYTTPADMTSVTLFRAGADDCNMGCFTSIPPMTSMVSTVPK